MDLITCDYMGHTKLVLVNAMRYAIQCLPMINIKDQVVWVVNQSSKASLTFGKRLFVQSQIFKNGMPWIVSKENVKIAIWSYWKFSLWIRIQRMRHSWIGSVSKRYLMERQKQVNPKQWFVWNISKVDVMNTWISWGPNCNNL